MRYPEFTWSFSRSTLFNDCKRKYYYYTYGKVDGWKEDADELNKKCYFLSMLTNINFLYGSIIHQVISEAYYDYVVKGDGKDQQYYLNMADELWTKAELINLDYLHGITGLSAKELQMLFLDVYKKDRSVMDNIPSYRNKTRRLLTTFFNSDFWKDIIEPGAAEHICGDCTNNRYETVELGNVKCYVLPDVVYKDKRTGRVVVIDWKTVSPKPKDIDQACFYAMAITSQYGIPREDIDIKIVYLGNNINKSDGSYPLVESVSFDQYYETVALEYLKKTSSLMLDYVEDRESNKPLPITSFEVTQDPGNCRFCQYYDICDDSPLKAMESYNTEQNTGCRDDFFDF